MAGNSISFDTGVRTFQVNETGSVSFNPTSVSFVNRLYQLFEKLAGLQEQWEKETEALQDEPAMVKFFGEKDKTIRAMLDELFGAPVSEGIFPGLNVFDFGSGAPVWVNFLLAVLDEMTVRAEAESKEAEKRMGKYLAKYRK